MRHVILRTNRVRVLVPDWLPRNTAPLADQLCALSLLLVDSRNSWVTLRRTRGGKSVVHEWFHPPQILEDLSSNRKLFARKKVNKSYRCNVTYEKYLGVANLKFVSLFPFKRIYIYIQRCINVIYIAFLDTDLVSIYGMKRQQVLIIPTFCLVISVSICINLNLTRFMSRTTFRIDKYLVINANADTPIS